VILFETDPVGARRVPFKRDALLAANVDAVRHRISVDLMSFKPWQIKVLENVRGV
jgi:hypothetical protein